MVLGEGIEPPKAQGRQIYSLMRLTAPQPQPGADRGIRTHDPLFTKQPL